MVDGQLFCFCNFCFYYVCFCCRVLLLFQHFRLLDARVVSSYELFVFVEGEGAEGTESLDDVFFVGNITEFVS